SHRRHLTPTQKGELIEKLLKAKPELSDRAIAQEIKVDHKTVGAKRGKLQATGEIPQSDKRTGADGKSRKQPARKPLAAPAEPAPEMRVLPPNVGGSRRANVMTKPLRAREVQKPGGARHRDHAGSLGLVLDNLPLMAMSGCGACPWPSPL